MSDQSHHSLKGSWRGCYYYESTTDSHGFEAVFIEQDGSVDGSILDDGRLGEARVAGTFSYPNLSFQKRYYNSTLEPITYKGTMSEDGKKIIGSWYINAKSKGQWVAWKIDGEELKQITETDEQLEEELERPKVLVSRSRKK